MRVSFLGKGGSGKTTVASAFIEYLNRKNQNVVAIDADMNVHLGEELNISVKPIGDEFSEISKYLENDSKNPIIGTTVPSLSSKFISSNLDDEFFKKFATRKDNTVLLTVGSYNDKLIGSSCYHSKLGGAELIYNRLLDDDNLFVVSDSTAGVDSVGTSMFFVSDINVFVVEPTQKSIGVYKDFERLSKRFNLKTYVIGNKINDEDDLIFLKNEIQEENFLGYIGISKDMKKYEQGKEKNIEGFLDENTEVFEKLISLLKNTPRDWEKYYRIALEVYITNCFDWYNSYYNDNLLQYIDHDFTYKKVIDKL